MLFTFCATRGDNQGLTPGKEVIYPPPPPVTSWHQIWGGGHCRRLTAAIQRAGDVVPADNKSEPAEAARSRRGPTTATRALGPAPFGGRMHGRRHRLPQT